MANKIRKYQSYLHGRFHPFHSYSSVSLLCVTKQLNEHWHLKIKTYKKKIFLLKVSDQTWYFGIQFKVRQTNNDVCVCACVWFFLKWVHFTSRRYGT